MDDRILQDILSRLQRLEDTAARLRLGVVTDRAGMDVDLGNSGVPQKGLKAVGGMEVDDKVAVLVSGNEMVALGKIGTGWTYGTGSARFDGQVQVGVFVAHNLGATPNVVLSSMGVGISGTTTIGLAYKDAATLGFFIERPGASTGDFGFYWLAIH